MFKSCSPYIKLFCNKGINWHFSLTQELLKVNAEKDKIIFLHIGYLSNIQIRENSVTLFSDPDVQKILNENFLPIIEDKEDKPESFLLGLDLLFANNDYSLGPINMFIMPDRRPIIAFSECDPKNFITIASSILAAKQFKRLKLEELATALSQTALYSGNITPKENQTTFNKNLINRYIESWFDKMFNNGFLYKMKPFTPSPGSILTIVEYLFENKDSKYYTKIEELLDHLLYSSLNDPIEGGFFRQATDYSCVNPLYEKSLEENSRFLLLYAAAYKLYNKESYKECALSIYNFITNSLEDGTGGLINSTTILGKLESVDYYSFSLNELSLLFPDEYQSIAKGLGLNTQADKMRKQIPLFNLLTNKVITNNVKEKLIGRRKDHKGYFKDRRSITSSNCVAITATVMASFYLNEPSLLNYSTKLFESIYNGYTNKADKRLNRYRCDCDLYLHGYLSDYANFIESSFSLYRYTNKKDYLDIAIEFLDSVILRFYKNSNGMFSKSEYGVVDDAIPFKRESNTDIIRPSANSVMAGNLITAYEFTKELKYLEMAKRSIANTTLDLLPSSPFLFNWANKIMALYRINP